MDAIGVVAAGEFELLALGRTGTDEHGIKTLLFQQLAHAGDRRIELQLHAHVEDQADLFVQHALRQPERGNIAAHQPARYLLALEDHHFIAERRQVVGHRERGRARADTGDALAVAFKRAARHTAGELALEIGGDALEPADRDRLFLDAPAPAGRLAGPVAHAAEDAREHVGFAIEQVGVGKTPLRDQPDVFWNIGMRRTGPLAIDDPMVMIGIRGICRIHDGRLV